MDHSLRTISYIADIGDILVIMARRRILTSPDETLMRRRRQAKILCHVFESDEVRQSNTVAEWMHVCLRYKVFKFSTLLLRKRRPVHYKT